MAGPVEQHAAKLKAIWVPHNIHVAFLFVTINSTIPTTKQANENSNSDALW